MKTSQNLNFVGQNSLNNFNTLFDFLKYYGVSYKDAAEALGINYSIVNGARNKQRLTHDNYDTVMMAAPVLLSHFEKNFMSDLKNMKDYVHLWSEDCINKDGVKSFLREN